MFDGYSEHLMFEPVVELKRKCYKCDKIFHLDDILRLYSRPVGKIGYAFVNGKDIKINMIESINMKNFKVQQIDSSSMKLIGKTRRGGQSALRYSRNRDAKRKDDVNKIADKILLNLFDFESHVSMVDILVLSGPSKLKVDISNVPEIKKYFNGKIRIHTSEKDNINGINREFHGELVDISDERINKVRDVFIRNPEKLIIGDKELLEHIEMCNISEIYVKSEKIEKKIRKRLLHEPNIIVIKNSKFLDDLGGKVGIKYY